VRRHGKESGDEYNNNDNNIVHLITRNNKVRKRSVSLQKLSLEGVWRSSGDSMKRLGVSQFKLIVHHSINTEKYPRQNENSQCIAGRQPDGSCGRLFIAYSRDGATVAFGPAPDALLELLATVSCPEISENKNKEWVCGEPISVTVHG
jgi:hypothetical protein